MMTFKGRFLLALLMLELAIVNLRAKFWDCTFTPSKDRKGVGKFRKLGGLR